MLLAEQPMHGYQMIQEIAERSLELWRPSPGSVYPTLQLLVDEGLVVSKETDGSKRIFALIDDGRAAAEKIAALLWQQIADGVDPGQVQLQTAVDRLFAAVTQAADAEHIPAAAGCGHRQQRPPRGLLHPRGSRLA